MVCLFGEDAIMLLMFQGTAWTTATTTESSSPPSIKIMTRGLMKTVHSVMVVVDGGMAAAVIHSSMESMVTPDGAKESIGSTCAIALPTLFRSLR